ncbi:family 78 glycoside hydrolase catalytic domain [Sphingobacterium oryzagri]|uniref:alpha-L-rhamnosidase n=1 Tax=Sphingobacterium oryzagri TaxID=3025669 RepID=A0ABY7WHI6_9SPHI|nr:alpha-L-rhamnosidase [Sphingobacterium sp. KACC 22765]WDF69081.1 family 78 glycoside hydrolase catalytic domain [Sphingobacterium sp. KACC 22765]
MKRLRYLIIIVFTALTCHVWAAVGVADLRCELLVDPITIDNQQPRLSWKINAEDRDVSQTAYHVLVSSSLANLEKNVGDLWDSGEVASSNSISVYYGGKALQSRQAVFWKVRISTNKGVSAWSSAASWQMGLLYYKDWTGRWIGFDEYFKTDNSATGQVAARYFRKEFTVAKPIKKAMVYVMGLGLYELYLNGKKVGDQVLAPSPTDYTENIKYNVFDVTALLKQGDQALGVLLGNGRFYAMRQAKPYKVKTFGFPKLQLQLILTYADGRTEWVKTDDSWKGTSEGPITANNEYDGERYDARKEWSGWAKAGFDDSQWLKARYVQEPGGQYEAQLNANMKVMKEISPVSVTKKGNGRYVLDFGQNFAGWVKMRVKGHAGTVVGLRFAESLTDSGELFTTNLRDAKATDEYILKGGEEEEWEPRFTYHGFRYVEVDGFPGEVKTSDFTGRVVYDDMATIGSFSSSNTLLNQIHQNAWWSIASNYKGMPVDCPQRNERQPWLGDRPMSAYGESFLFDNTLLYTKWLEDIRLSQQADGAIPDVAPAFWRYYSDNVSWPGTYLFIAEMLFKQTGDIRILKKHYPYMKKWMDYMRVRYMDAEGIIGKDSYGDWCFPPRTIEDGRGKIADKKYPSALISAAYYYHLLGLMERFSKLTDNAADSDTFTSTAAQLKIDFNKKFYHAAGYYGTNSLTDNLLPLYFGLADAQNVDKVAARVVTIVEKENNGHLSTGVVGTQWIMRTLTNIGRADLAYRLATKKTYPSWGYMVENGATSIWELWNGNTAHPKMNSQNHVMMLGDLLIWYYEHLAGIQSGGDAFQSIVMKPSFVEGLDDVDASYESLQGKISSSWKKNKSLLAWHIGIPPNTKATIYVPTSDVANITEGDKKLTQVEGVKYLRKEKDELVLEVGSGNYQFKIKR